MVVEASLLGGVASLGEEASQEGVVVLYPIQVLEVQVEEASGEVYPANPCGVLVVVGAAPMVGNGLDLEASEEQESFQAVVEEEYSMEVVELLRAVQARVG